MKRCLLIVLVFLTLFSSCFSNTASDSKQPSTVSIANSIMKDKVFDGEMISQSSETFMQLFDLNMDLVDEFCVYSSKSGEFADEIAIIKVKDKSVRDDITDTFEKRTADLLNKFQQDNSEQLIKVKNNVIFSKGVYFVFAITNDNDVARKTFEDSF